MMSTTKGSGNTEWKERSLNFGKDVPGPGQYDSPTSRSKNNCIFTKTRRFQEQPDYISFPGPGQYRHDSFRLTKQSSLSHSFTNKNVIRDLDWSHNVLDSPSPHQYKVAFDWTRSIAPKFGSQPKDSPNHSNVSSFPSPFSYTIPSVFDGIKKSSRLFVPVQPRQVPPKTFKVITRFKQLPPRKPTQSISKGQRKFFFLTPNISPFASMPPLTGRQVEEMYQKKMERLRKLELRAASIKKKTQELMATQAIKQITSQKSYRG